MPAIWRALRTAGGLPPGQERVGVVDVSGAGESLPYWAGSVMEEGASLPAGLAHLPVPAQTYAVLSHVGPSASWGRPSTGSSCTGCRAPAIAVWTVSSWSVTPRF